MFGRFAHTDSAESVDMHRDQVTVTQTDGRDYSQKEKSWVIGVDR